MKRRAKDHHFSCEIMNCSSTDNNEEENPLLHSYSASTLLHPLPIPSLLTLPSLPLPSIREEENEDVDSLPPSVFPSLRQSADTASAATGTSLADVYNNTNILPVPPPAVRRTTPRRRARRATKTEVLVPTMANGSSSASGGRARGRC